MIAQHGVQLYPVCPSCRDLFDVNDATELPCCQQRIHAICLQNLRQDPQNPPCPNCLRHIVPIRLHAQQPAPPGPPVETTRAATRPQRQRRSISDPGISLSPRASSITQRTLENVSLGIPSQRTPHPRIVIETGGEASVKTIVGFILLGTVAIIITRVIIGIFGTKSTV